MAIWKATEWETTSGWHANCVDNLAKGSGAWWHPARILGISPAQFIELLLTKYKPDHFMYSKDTCFCTWSWSDQNKMREFKNFINRKAREANYQI
jgi:Uma2 family endonuclease